MKDRALTFQAAGHQTPTASPTCCPGSSQRGAWPGGGVQTGLLAAPARQGPGAAGEARAGPLLQHSPV